MPSQAVAIDNQVRVFSANLQRIVKAARARVIADLNRRLKVSEEGKVKTTKANLLVLQSVDVLFRRAMNIAGYQALVAEHVKAYSGQFQFFDETLTTLGREIGRDLSVSFSKRDKLRFAQQQISSIKLLASVVEQVAANAERDAMLSVGGVTSGELSALISEQLGETTGRATTLADTSLSTFYRTITDRGYKLVEQGLPASIPVLYKYAGPNDRLIRPFCARMLKLTEQGKLWTREEIDALENGQLANPFLTCGGYNCRHQWLMVLRAMTAGA